MGTLREQSCTSDVYERELYPENHKIAGVCVYATQRNKSWGNKNMVEIYALSADTVTNNWVEPVPHGISWILLLPKF